jgi:hypothetical protein
VNPNSTDKLSGQILRSKISIKLLIHMWPKTLSLRDNQQTRKNNYDLNSLGFYGVICALNRGRNFDNFCKLYSSFLFLYVSSKNSTRFLLLVVEFFSRLSRKLIIFDPICIKSFMLIFDHRICPESLSGEFGYTLYK